MYEHKVFAEMATRTTLPHWQHTRAHLAQILGVSFTLSISREVTKDQTNSNKPFLS